ncbi:MAG: CZB domain-containing protein [Candidatus Latescibacteria bacterium]|nr:CZB domain-containing protein [Candidatus Latescibacterota bacterium]
MKWNNLSIGNKIGIGFGMVILTLIVVACWSIFGIGGIVRNAAEVIAGNKLRGEMTQREVDHLNWANQVNALLTDANVTELSVETDPHKCAFGKWYYSDARKEAERLVPELKSFLDQIEEPHNHLHESAVEIGKHFHQADVELGNMLRESRGDHLAWIGTVKDAMLHNRKSVDVQMDPHLCKFGKWYYSDAVQQMRKKDPEFDRIMASIEEPHNKLHASANQIQNYLKAGQNKEALTYFTGNTEKFAEETLAHIENLLKWQDARMAGMNKANEIYATRTKPNLEKIQEFLGKVNHTVEQNVMTDEEMLHAASSTRFAVITLSIIATIMGIFLAVVISRGIVKALKYIIDNLNSGAEQVAAAANQVSSSSQQLAEGSSEQASSLEEISSSLEEMTSMTKQNTENAKQADMMANETSQAAEKGSTAMVKMEDAIQKIKTSSDETAKIIKTIDEIAFQTNLLALNAAVEAARAGEAGMGFAVVAEEVRNLAQRSAEAAKNTAELIDGSQTNADNGVAVTTEVSEILKEIATSSKKVKQLIGEVSAASVEQSQGITQVNSALTQMDQVTQGTAANAEESASASEELSSQAGELNMMVAQLVALVGGNGSNNNASKPKKTVVTKPAKVLAARTSKLSTFKKGAVAATKVVSPEDVIPLDDDFEEF